MNSRNFLILIVPGLVLLLLFSVGSVKTLASMSAPAVSDPTLSGLLVEGGALAQALVIAAPTFSVTMTPAPASLAEPGGTVTFTIDIINEGSDEIFVIRIVDNVYGGLKPGDGDPPPDPNVTENTCIDLASIPGTDQVQCSFKAPVTGPPGDYVNEVTVTTEDAFQDPATEVGTAMVTVEDVPSSIVTTLSAVPTSMPEPGGNVAFTVNVHNTSAVDTVTISALSGTAPLDNLVGKGTCTGFPRTLVAGASFGCSVTVFVPGTQGQVKSFTVTASGTDDDGGALEEDSNTVQITFTAPEMTQRIFLPVVARIHAVGEPNNSCAQAYGISINTDFYFLPDDKEDWYRFNLAGSGNLTVELTNFVPVLGQIVLYQGSSCNNLQLIANNGNFSSTKTINTAVGAGTYYVRVITDGPFSSTPYKLRIGFP